MKLHQNALSAKVAALNRAHTILKDLAPKVQAAMQPFIGYKVELAGGGLAKKFHDALEPFRVNERGTRVWYDRSTYSFRLFISTNESGHSSRGGETHQSVEVYAHMGKLDGRGNLEALETFTPDYYRTDYTAETIMDARKRLEVAEKAVSAINNELSHFGKWEANP